MTDTVDIGARGADASEAARDYREPFRNEVDDLFRRRLRVCTGVLFGLHLAAVFVFDDHIPNALARAFQLALFPFTAASFGLTYYRRLESLVRPLSATFILVVSAYAAFKNVATGGDPLDIRSLSLTILTAGLLFPFEARHILGVASAIMGFFLVGTRGFVVDAKVLTGQLFFLVAATILAALTARLGSRLREREFRARFELEIANRKNEALLENMLPKPIVARLRDAPGAVADRHAEATVMFADLVGFTSMSAALPPEKLVSFLNDLFSRIDALTTKLGLEKIKTIGDAYMVAGGLPEPRADHAEAVARLALGMRDLVATLETPHEEPLAVRIGIHTGPVVAGVIGATKLTYDLWGDTVNTASRMESHAEPGMIQVTEATHERLRDHFRFEPRGTIQVKGKGPMAAYALLGPLEGDRRGAGV